MDVTTAFLNGELEEEVFMRQPEGYAVKGKENLVCRLKKSIYGLKQSPRCWNSVLDDYLKKLGFVQVPADPCLYVLASEGEICLIAVYVDDILLAGSCNKRLTAVKQALAKKFQVKDMGELHYFLGVKVIQDRKNKRVWIGQQSYTENILRQFGMEDAKTIRTPVDTSTKLVKGDDDEMCVDQSLYQSAVGSLLYLSLATRPDITFAVSNVAKYCTRPTNKHWTAVKRIFRYLKGTQNYGLCYSKDDSGCVGFSDADWGGDLDTRRSTSGYVFRFGGAAITWRSKRQACVALSTAEAEYVALAGTVQESLWLQQLLSDLQGKPADPMVIFEDNQSAMSMSKNPKFHGRSKHIDIKYHFTREQVSNGKIVLKYCKTSEMTADFLTKGLNGEQFEKLRLMAGVVPMTEHS